jgi:hypothetical protein
MPRQTRDHFLGSPVRQAAERDIDPGPVGVLDLHQRRQLQMAELRKHLRQWLAGLPIGGEQRISTCGWRASRRTSSAPV